MNSKEVIEEFEFDEKKTESTKKTISWKGMHIAFTENEEGYTSIDKIIDKHKRNKSISIERKIKLIQSELQAKIKFSNLDLVSGDNFELFRQALYEHFYINKPVGTTGINPE